MTQYLYENKEYDWEQLCNEFYNVSVDERRVEGITLEEYLHQLIDEGYIEEQP